MDIDIAIVGHALEFWKARRSSIDFPLYSRDDQEWFSVEFRVWRDTWGLVFVFDLSSSVLTDMPLPVDILSQANDLALEPLQVKSYIHYALDIKYRREGNKPSKP